MALNSAGTLVGAILESAGYIYQANLLDSLTAPLKDEIGALIYLLGVAIVIVQFTVLKSAKMAPWLLIGPALFSAVILDRSPIEQTKWSFGSNERNQAEVTKGTKKVTEGQSGSSNVSTVFRKFVTMSSAVTRSMVDTINGVQLKNDIWFIAKGQFFGAMTNHKEDDAGLLGLIHYGLTGQCFDVIQAAKSANNPLYRLNATDLPASVKGAVDEHNRYWAQSQTEADIAYQKLLNLPYHSFQNNTKVLEYVKNLKLLQFKSLADVVNFFLGFLGFGPEFTNFALGLYTKSLENDTTYSCRIIWDLTLLGILEKSKVIEATMEKRAEDLGIEKDSIKNLLGQASGIQGGRLLSTNGPSAITSQDIVRIIAKYFLRNEMRSTEMGSQIAEFAGRHDLRKLDTRLEGDFSASERDRLSVQEWSEKERLAHAAYSLPVYQGLVLYFLGLTFPFFALLLLIPGKASGFLIWFSLWIWAKSWDVGMAVVMQLDTIFWSLYSVQKQKAGGSDFVPDDLQAALVALDKMDPTFQMSGYYTLLAVCVLAIPPVTANLILGSMRAGTSFISGGINQFSDFFASNMAARVQQGVITALKSDAISLRELRGLAYSLGGQGKADLLEGRQDRGLTSESSAVRARMETGTNPYSSNLSRALSFASATEGKFGGQAQYRRNADAAAKIDLSQGIATPTRVLSSSYSGVSTSLMELYHMGPLTVEKAANVGEYEKIKKQAEAEVAQANFEGSVDAQAYEIHRRIGNMGGIPIPWVIIDDDGSAKEVGRHLAEFDMRMGMLRSYTEAIEKSVSAGAKTYDEVKKYIQDPEKREAPETSALESLGWIGIGAGTSSSVGWLYEKFWGRSDNADINARIREMEHDQRVPQIIREDAGRLVNSNHNIVDNPEDVNPRRFRNMEFGGDEDEREAGVIRSLRERRRSRYGNYKN